MKKNIFLSIIIPCYNESENIKRGVLREVNNFLSKTDYKWEVIISDDASTDNSRKLVEEEIKNWKNFTHIVNPHGGKPSALRYGLKKSVGRYVLFTDMDQSTPIIELEKLIPFVKSNKVIIGSRGVTRKNFPFYRKAGSFVFSNFRKLMLLPEINDTQCGFKLFESNIIKENFDKLEFFKKNRRTNGWQVTSYDVELLHILKKTGASIKEVVVAWHDKDISRSKGSSISRYLRESWEMFTQIVRVKLNDLRGLYD
jgi:dolichyl-phosphate beta-glucosyltransferase